MYRSSPAYRVLLGLSALWCVLIVAPAFLGPRAGAVVDACFAPVCHQWESHSLHLFGTRLAVCARCTAIYVAFLAGALAAPWLRRTLPARGTLAAAAAPILADVLLDLAPWYDPTLASRLLTGAWCGVLLALVLVPLVVAAFPRPSTGHRPVHPPGEPYAPAA